jgi:hypothetical protein
MSRRTLRFLVVWGGASGVLAGAGPRPGDLPSTMSVGAWGAWATGDPEQALVTTLGLAAWLVLAWLALGALAVAGGRSAGTFGAFSRRLSTVLLPRLLRDGLSVALGLSVVVGSAGSAAAAPVARPALALTATTATEATAVPSLDRLPPGSLTLAPLTAVPPPVLAPAATPAPRPSAGNEAPTEVVVHRGDCLWSVVARHLGATATDEQIARAWPDWYAANRGVIGSDPGLLLPGQRLLAPPPR